MKDHRELGKEMQLFTFDEEVGAGLPLWLPDGTVLIEELEKLAKEREFLAAYQRVKTPHIAKRELYTRSGHLPLYADSMFPSMLLKEEDESYASTEYFLKAMNCPHHHKIFGVVPRSYRDLPLRLAEYGTCYRYESAGSLMGLMRVRSMQMNDAHIYCAWEDFEQEFSFVHEMTVNYLKEFGIKDYVVRFSKHDPAKIGQKYADEPGLWELTENRIRDVLENAGIDNYVEVPDEAAFYGPKIDFLVRSEMGREFTLATHQVDFVGPLRFDLKYRDQNNELKTPVCIHRAPLGTHERFIAFLIEHYQGKFPLWLAPRQASVLTVNGDNYQQENHAKILVEELRRAGIRADANLAHEPIAAKIQRAEQDKVHSIMVIGHREVQGCNVNLRRRGANHGARLVSALIHEMTESIEHRVNE